MSNLLSPPGDRYKAKNEYESSVFILGDNDIVLNPKNDVRGGFSPQKQVMKKSVVLLFIVSVLAALMIVLPKPNSAEACGVTDPLSCVTEATEKLTNKVVDSFKGIFCSAGDPAVYTFPESAWAGTGSMMFPSGLGAIKGAANVAKGMNLDQSKPFTAYEKYGTSGTNFTFFRDKIEGVQEYSCVPFAKLLGNTAANSIFSMTETISSFTGWVYSFAVATDAFSGMIDSLDKILGSEKTGIIGKLYINYMAPMIMLGALYALWFGIVKRAFTVAGSGIIWMLLSIVCGLSIMYNASGFINFSNGVVQSMVSQTTGVIGGLSADDDSDAEGQNDLPDLCSLPGEKVGGVMSSDKVQRIVSCRIWQAFVYYPWATGQFGVPPNQGNITSGDVNVTIKFGPGNDKKLDFRAAQLDSQSLDYTNPIVGKQTSEAIKNKVKAYGEISKAMTTDSELRGYANSWAGNDIQNRLNIAIFSVIAALGGTLVIISVSLSMIIYQVGTIFLILVSPLFLLIGIHPGFGKGIALKWLELLLETVLKRIVLGIFVSVIVSVFMFLATSSASVGYMETLLLLIVLSIAGLMYKNKFLDLVSSLNLGGTQTGMEGSKNKVKGAAKSALLMGAGAGIGMAKVAPNLGKVAGAASKAKIGQGATTKAASKFGKSQANKTLLKAGFSGAKGGMMNKHKYNSDTVRSIRGANQSVDKNPAGKWESQIADQEAEQKKVIDQAEADKKKRLDETLARDNNLRQQQREMAKETENANRIAREQRMASSMDNILLTLRGGTGQAQAQPQRAESDVKPTGGTNSKPNIKPAQSQKPPAKPGYRPTVKRGESIPSKPQQKPTSVPPKPQQKPDVGQVPRPEQNPQQDSQQERNLPPRPEQKPSSEQQPKQEGSVPPKPSSGQPPKSEGSVPPKPSSGQAPKPEPKPSSGQPPKSEPKPSSGQPPKSEPKAKPKPKPEPKPEPKAQPKPKPEPKPEPKAQPKPEQKAPPKPEQKSNGGQPPKPSGGQPPRPGRL